MGFREEIDFLSLAAERAYMTDLPMWGFAVYETDIDGCEFLRIGIITCVSVILDGLIKHALVRC